ncbi:mas-related G-protein coupled receptor member F-like isoform X2 [Paroedura picta]
MTMKDGFNLKALFPSHTEKYLLHYDFIGDRIILSVFIILFCLVGLAGNGKVIWLLGFRVKRKPFATYILNLAAVDFGSLAILLLFDMWLNPPSFEYFLPFPDELVKVSLSLFFSLFSSRQLLLTAISVDRWVSLLFPNWYQRHRSAVCPTTVCTFIWALSFALTGVPVFLLLTDSMPIEYGFLLWAHLGTTLICNFSVILCTLSLLIRICLKSQRCRCGGLFKVILLMLLSFLLFTILTYGSFVMHSENLLPYIGLWTSIKCSVNPLIFFLAGRQNDGKFQERLKVNFQRVFKEERDPRMELELHTQTTL